MWFLFAMLTALAWGAADLFYKKGSSDAKDSVSHLKIVVMVGLVMGAHAVIYMISTGTRFDPVWMIRYAPVSAMYILSMTVGYFGLRYIELSISSPVQNSSGAITTILFVALFAYRMNALEIAGVACVTLGVVLIALYEKRDEDAALSESGAMPDGKYRYGAVAIAFPVLYALLDGLGTFADAVYLDEMAWISETDALLAYEFTFFLCAVGCYAYIRLVKKARFNFLAEREKGYAALFETAGQFFYVYAMSEEAAIAAPLIASYSIFSILLSRIFLKEKLKRPLYLLIFLVILGIALLGLSEGLA